MAVREPGEVRGAAREILNGPEFAKPENEFWSELARAALDPVGTISKGLDWLLRQSGAGTGNAVFAWAIVLIAVAIIVFVVFRVTQSMTSDESLPRLLAPDTGVVGWQDLEVQAEELEAQGEWRKALRLRYAALVDRLSEEGVVERRPGRTTGEYLRQVQNNAPDAAPSFGEATSIFESVWYGQGEADHDVVSTFRRLADSSTRLVTA